MKKDYYAILQVSPKASAEVIDGAWRSLLKVAHPDLPTGDADRAKLINEAHDVLCDPELRAAYDAERKAEEDAAKAAAVGEPRSNKAQPREPQIQPEPHPSVYYSREDPGWAAAAAKTARAAPKPLPRVSMSFRERLALTWSITWPLLGIDVVWAIALHAAVDGNTNTAETAFQAVSFFFLGPMIIRRAIQGGTNLHEIRVWQSGQESKLAVGDALSIFWLLAWRSLVLALLALVPLSLLLKSVVPAGVNDWVRALAASPISNALGLTAVDGIMNMAFVPFLIPAMLKKKYRMFTLELRRREDASQMKSASPKHFKRNLSKR